MGGGYRLKKSRDPNFRALVLPLVKRLQTFFFTSNALWFISLNICVNLAQALDGYVKAV